MKQDSQNQIGIQGGMSKWTSIAKTAYIYEHVQRSGKSRERSTISLIVRTVTARLNPGFATTSRKRERIMRVNTVSDACILITSDLIRRIGLLDVSLTLAFQEEVAADRAQSIYQSAVIPI